MRNTKHILDVKPVVKNIFSVEMKQQSKWQRANEAKCTHHGRKSIWKHKRNIQCQKISWSH